MKKTILIIQREYLTRIRKKTFIIGTILLPVLYILMIFGTGYITNKTKQELKVGLIDQSGYFTQNLVSQANAVDTMNKLVLIKSTEAEFSKAYDSLGYNGYIVIPQNIDWKGGLETLSLKTNKTYGMGVTAPVTSKLNSIWDEVKNDSLGIDAGKQQIMRSSRLNVKLSNEKNKDADSGIATVIGYVCGFLMYLILLLYGSQVMMGVTEEKTNRIAEVMVSSVKPFQLMMGKIIGIGMVALTQFLIWIACIFVIYNIGKFTGGNEGMMADTLGKVQYVFSSVNVYIVVGCFIFYLLAGFFFYSSLYAAIGSAINEDMREAQSLSFPITLLIIFSIVLLAPTIQNPSSPVAVWASIIPFSAPIVMMARIPFGVPNTVPLWQLGLSMALLIAAFIFTTWFAGKIYRTGILMYGKKPSWKEMMKWAFRK